MGKSVRQILSDAALIDFQDLADGGRLCIKLLHSRSGRCKKWNRLWRFWCSFQNGSSRESGGDINIVRITRLEAGGNPVVEEFFWEDAAGDWSLRARKRNGLAKNKPSVCHTP